MLVLASPIYWFDISAQIKCFIDRMYACAKTGFHITSAAMLLDSGSPGVYNAAQAQLKDICDYLKWENKGAFTAPGMVEKEVSISPRRLHRSGRLRRICRHVPVSIWVPAFSIFYLPSPKQLNPANNRQLLLLPLNGGYDPHNSQNQHDTV